MEYVYVTDELSQPHSYQVHTRADNSKYYILKVRDQSKACGFTTKRVNVDQDTVIYTAPQSKLKDCGPDRERSMHSHRCVKKCSPTQIRNITGHCVNASKLGNKYNNLNEVVVLHTQLPMKAEPPKKTKKHSRGGRKNRGGNRSGCRSGGRR